MRLPAVVREGAVRFRHAVRVLALLDRIAAVLRRVHQLARQAGRHRFFRAGARRRNEPADGQSLGALGAHLDRNLVGGAADAAAADLDARLHIVERIMEDLQRVLLEAGLDAFQGTIDDTFRNPLLAGEHDRIAELRQDDVPELRIGEDLALLWATTTGHWRIPLFERRACLKRAARPTISLKPRLTWAAWRRTWSATDAGP